MANSYVSQNRNAAVACCRAFGSVRAGSNGFGLVAGCEIQSRDPDYQTGAWVRTWRADHYDCRINDVPRALAKASPRIKLYSYAQTWEGRTLRYAVIGSEDKMRRDR